MRFGSLGVVILLGCSPTQVKLAMAPARAVVAAPMLAAPVAPAVAPTAAKTPVTEQARVQARAAFATAIELWSKGRVTEAQTMVDLGLTVMGRHLPEDAAPQRPAILLERTAFSDGVGSCAVADAETLLTADPTTGRLLGLRLLEDTNGQAQLGISPKGSVVVAASGADLTVYETRGLALRQRIAVRQDAPFAFVADDKLVTVRLGRAGSAIVATRGQLLQRSLGNSTNDKTAVPDLSDSASDSGVSDAELSDDEIVLVDLSSGRTDQVLKLTAPPDQGLMRKVASLPPSRRCNDIDECRNYELNPVPIGRRVQQLKIASGMVVAAWHGGATTIHRLKDGKLIGAFRSRGERYKPGLVAIWPHPARAAVATSLPNVGRGTEPPFSVTALVDLNLGRVLEIIDECRWATGLAFSEDGTQLMVGDLRRACLHDARNGRYLETTEEVRPASGYDDNLQDVSVRPLPQGRWLLTTADGAFGVFDGKNGKALVRGKSAVDAGLVTSDDRSLFVADFSQGAGQLLTFGPAGVERRLLRTEELEQKEFPPEAADSPEGRRVRLLETVHQASCLVEGFRLPRELCHLPPIAQ